MERKATRKLNHPSHHQTPHHQGNNETDDAVHLFQLFPEEVWHFILQHVDPTTYHKLCGAASLFEMLLSPHRIHILFGPVLEILMDHYCKWRMESFGEEIDDSDDDDGKYPFRKLSCLRLVCRSWKNRINCYLQNLPRWYETNFNYKLDIHQYRHSSFMGEMEEYFSPVFRVSQEFIHFDGKFKSTHLTENPLAARRIYIDMGYYSWKKLGFNSRSLTPFYDACLEWLRQYGKHVWYLSLEINETQNLNQVEFYYRLKDMLELLPNLKSFRFVLSSSPEPIADDNQLQELVSTYKDIVISRNILYMNLQGLPIILGKQLVIQLPHLTHLELALETPEEFWQFFNEDQRLPNFSCIKKLSISLPAFPDTRLAPYFLAIETNFGETLTSLELWFPKTVPFLLEDRLNLPKLKKLQVAVVRTGAAVALDFLLDMSDHLEELGLAVEWDGNHIIEKFQKMEREIKFYKHLDNLHESNIWANFAKLRWVKVWRGIINVPLWHCTRDEWKIQNRKK